VSPTQANLILFFLGPLITLIFSLLGYAVIPYGPGLAVSDYHLGILYMLAVSSLSTYGILLAGWSANSKYAFLGSLRSTAQLISYELILSSAILLIILFTGSLNLTDIVESQKSIWFIIPLLPVFIIFFIGALAETNRAPMDLAEAESVKRKSFYNDIIQIIQILLSFFRFIIDSVSIMITICLKGSTLLGTLRDEEGDKPISLKCNSPMCYALLAGNQIYGHPWMLNWVGSSETTCDHLTYFYIFIIEIKLKYDIVQCIIYELSSGRRARGARWPGPPGLMKLRPNFFLLNLSFLLVFILFTGAIFIYQVLFDCEHLVLLYYWDSFWFCSVVPVKVFNDLDKLESIKSYRNSLKTKSGVYGIYNTVNKKQYIGSAKDLYQRLLEHIAGNKSNKALQRGVKKYGWNKFRFFVYKYYSDSNKVVRNSQLTDLETKYIGKFKFSMLYNFKKTATSMLGYKHTEEALLKMIERYKNKENHPFFGKTHTEEAKKLISKPGKENPMFGRKHSEATKLLISRNMSKYPGGVELYSLNNNLLKTFNNNVELATYLKISKTTVGRYIKSGKMYNKMYYFKINDSSSSESKNTEL